MAVVPNPGPGVAPTRHILYVSLLKQTSLIGTRDVTRTDTTVPSRYVRLQVHRRSTCGRR